MKKAEEKLVKKDKIDEIKIDPDEMLRAGLQFGHKTSKTNPKMKPYIFGVRNSIHIFDLEKTVGKLGEALKFIQELISDDKILLFVGTKIQIKNLLKETATQIGFPYVTERWLGGTITNWKVIKNRIDYFKSLERKKEEGELEKYTKKERIKINEEMQKLKTKFEGIKEMPRIPDAIFVIDVEEEALAIREAKKKGIKIIGICDTNADPSLVDYPIPANDDAISSARYILDKVKEAILKAKKQAKKE